MNITSSYKCPYCQHKNIFTVDLTCYKATGRKAVYCCLEEGGCDKMLVLEFKVDLKFNTRKVVGE